MKNKKTVLVAMSGGVDSSVTAALLKEQGYSIIGITMRLSDEEESMSNVLPDRPCCSIEMTSRARRVCDVLGVAHYVVDFREVFQKQVKDNFFEQYITGTTPNPCVRCNTYIKWKPLVRKKNALGADYIATGHYARSVLNDDTGKFELRRGLDHWKDQTYFLWGLSEEQLSYTLFPLGDITKKEVRSLAKMYNLPTWNAPESQEICFIPDNNYRRYVEERLKEQGLPASAGEIRDRDGNVLGSHPGYHNFTIGQRKGLGITLGEAAYVTEIDTEENTLVVGNVEDLMSDSLQAESVCWVDSAPSGDDVNATIKIRYRDPGSEGKLFPEGSGKVTVRFSEPVRAVTPGQSVVFYKDDRVLGGGIISKGK
ncbi:tRNA 2-thiouridine(34) synthase MnmA [candidate division KSB1 bacterium]|nr:tRNA 2-thiouridine(34) synthase MnmA [candidate division KSB1 bacterium]